MGKSTASCFKIITCVTDSVDHGDIQTPQSKVSSGRNGWSFRKRSARHEVLSNTVVTEAPSSAAKSYVQPNLTVPEKTSVIQCPEQKDKVSSQLDSNMSDIISAKEDDYGADGTLGGYLGQRVPLKEKSVIKLQAAVRGHLVRHRAVATLLCVQAILKMQTLVRARIARLLVEGSGDFEERRKNSAKDNLNSKRGKREPRPSGTHTCTSIEKLLNNRFACQLMGSTLRTKPINIKCDPSKYDSAWKWLEIWTLASSLSSKESVGCGSVPEQVEKESFGYSGFEGDIPASSDFQSDSKQLKSAEGPSAEPSENDENSITYDVDNLDIHARSFSHSTHHPYLQIMEDANSMYEITESVTLEIKETDLPSKVDAKTVPNKTRNGQEIPVLINLGVVQHETEGKWFREASNHSFIAAQSKFEQLSSAATCEKLFTLSGYHLGVESSTDKISTSTDPPLRSKDIGFDGSSISNAWTVQIAVSDCGTELSISSTLDSPDMSEGLNDIEQEPNLSEASDNPNIISKVLGSDLSYTNTNQWETHKSVHHAAYECVDSTIVSGSSPLERKLEADDIVTLRLEPGSEASHLIYKSTYEASPRNNVALPESQATPSRHVSLNPKKNAGERRADKRGIAPPNQGSATQSSLELLKKERKTEKRRKSFGSAKLYHAGQEPRHSSSINSLRSYMQATESTRAKALPNGSLRSSPDVQDKDIFIKPRPSLSGTNGRQGSPCIRRSPSQAQQNAKGNGIHSPQEHLWRR